MARIANARIFVALAGTQEAASMKDASGHDGVDHDTAAAGVGQQQRPAAFRGSIRRTAVVLSDDR
jgi:hypothetical protein